MLTRRGFILTSGSALGALSLASAASAAALGRTEVLTITSINRTVPAAVQGARHITLTGNLVEDFATIEKVLAQAPAEELHLTLDAADEVLVDIAMTRVSSDYAPLHMADGSRAFRRNSTFLGA